MEGEKNKKTIRRTEVSAPFAERKIPRRISLKTIFATPQSKSKSKTQTGVGIIITKKRYTTPHHHHHHTGSFMNFSVNSHKIESLASYAYLRHYRPNA